MILTERTMCQIILVYSKSHAHKYLKHSCAQCTPEKSGVSRFPVRIEIPANLSKIHPVLDVQVYLSDCTQATRKSLDIQSAHAQSPGTISPLVHKYLGDSFISRLLIHKTRINSEA